MSDHNPDDQVVDIENAPSTDQEADTVILPYEQALRASIAERDRLADVIEQASESMLHDDYIEILERFIRYHGDYLEKMTLLKGIDAMRELRDILNGARDGVSK